MESYENNTEDENFKCYCNDEKKNKLQRKYSTCKDIVKNLTTSYKQMDDEGKKLKRKSSLQNIKTVQDIKGKLQSSI